MAEFEILLDFGDIGFLTFGLGFCDTLDTDLRGKPFKVSPIISSTSFLLLVDYN